MVNGKIIKGMVMVFGLMENKNMKGSISKENNMDKVLGHLERVKSMKDNGWNIKDMGLGFGLNIVIKWGMKNINMKDIGFTVYFMEKVFW